VSILGSRGWNKAVYTASQGRTAPRSPRAACTLNQRLAGIALDASTRIG